MNRSLQTFRSDQHGGVAITTALTAVAFMGFAVMALDTASFYSQRRHQQTVGDLAALAAASQLSAASQAAAASVVANGYASADIASTELGTYVQDASVAPARRFTPGTSGTPNAVRVTLRRVEPALFGAFTGASAAPLTSTSVTMSGVATIQTKSIAAAESFASFSLGSGLLAVNGGIENSLLSALLGTGVSLQAMDFSALVNTNVDVFAFSNALATRANLTAGTYNGLLSGNIRLATALAALADAVRPASTQAASALMQVVAALGVTSTVIPLGQLIDYGPYGSLQVGAKPISAMVSAFDLLSSMAQIANGSHQVQTALSLGIPGILAANLTLSIGEPAVGSSFVDVGQKGARLTTAQTRLRLTLQVAGPSPTSLLSVPLVFDIAPATAELDNLSCTNADVTTTTLRVGVTPGVMNAWIANVSDQDVANLSTPLNPPSATLANLLGVVNVSGKAHASMANPSETLVSFTAAEAMAGTSKTVSTTDYLSPLVASLIGGLQVNVTLLGLSLISPPVLQQAVAQTLVADVSPIDSALATVLTTLGIRVGNATVQVSGVKCGQSTLVN